ncbi:hypothetical protein EYZ11_001075 [Aspergillus tanneri]|uniref:RNase H type-1 domain-containing protein n=1 Tax=Aspergillus tanneri TaxID=1220188 RepID=A0A4S3JVK6_9EURO|nr:uncharacterized protein ATNIH1004_009702 [Aspergillus tanneri]KAA8642941.1 hypothetical protein ATNIH1004_009702 [Aspergillus tanneri]THC99437.1 hypothetical protein EYZ11_001075 [Aspergillus tanneri]
MSVTDLKGPHNLELFATGTALRTALTRVRGKSAVLTLFQVSRCRDRDLVEMVIALAHSLVTLGIEVEIHWIPGHIAHPAHKPADAMARAASNHGALYAEGWAVKTSLDDTEQVMDSCFLKLREGNPIRRLEER